MATRQEEIKQGLLRKAAMDKNLLARVTAAQGGTGTRLLTASQRRDLVEAVGLVTAAKVEPSESITKMPGFSPQQLRAQISRLAKLRQDMTILAKQNEAMLAQMAGLEKEEKKGLDLLKKAAVEMNTKGKFVAEAEDALLEFTAFSQEKTPGIAQMIATDTKGEEKAGDLFGRISAKLGAEIAAAVQVIYTQCSEDLTHTAMAIRGLKVVAKTSSLHPLLVKNAGLADTVVGIKTWLSGKADAAAAKILGFVGDVTRWFKGFLERTKMVNTATKDLKGALKDAMSQTNAMLKG